LQRPSTRPSVDIAAELVAAETKLAEEEAEFEALISAEQQA